MKGPVNKLAQRPPKRSLRNDCPSSVNLEWPAKTKPTAGIERPDGAYLKPNKKKDKQTIVNNDLIEMKSNFSDRPLGGKLHIDRKVLKFNVGLGRSRRNPSHRRPHCPTRRPRNRSPDRSRAKRAVEKTVSACFARSTYFASTNCWGAWRNMGKGECSKRSNSAVSKRVHYLLQVYYFATMGSINPISACRG